MSAAPRHVRIEGDGFVLRPTTGADLDDARSLFTNPGFYEHWDGAPKGDPEITEKYLGRRFPSVECFFVQVNADVVGLAQWHVADDGGPGGGMDLVLLPDARGRGLGSAIVLAMVDHVRTHLGWQRFTVDPAVANERGVHFWTTVGFSPRHIVERADGRFWHMEWPMHGANMEQ